MGRGLGWLLSTRLAGWARGAREVGGRLGGKGKEMYQSLSNLNPAFSKEMDNINAYG